VQGFAAHFDDEVAEVRIAGVFGDDIEVALRDFHLDAGGGVDVPEVRVGVAEGFGVGRARRAADNAASRGESPD
jgi:hypothetical protein